jgi:hypothetical protein
MGLEAAALPVHFCGQTTLITCDDPELTLALRHHFRHCLDSPRNGPVTTYHIAVEGDDWLRLEQGEAVLYRGPRSPYLLECLMQEVTTALVGACRERPLFHAAGVLFDGHGLLLGGASGNGKSTLAGHLTAAGGDYLSDEVVAVAPDGREMSGFPRPLILKAGAAFLWRELLSEEAYPKLAHLPGGAVWLDPELLRAGCVRRAAPVSMLLFPCYTAGAPFAAQPLTPAEAAFRLMQLLVNAKNLPGHGFAAATRLARQTPAYSLTYAEATEVMTWLTWLH